MLRSPVVALDPELALLLERLTGEEGYQTSCGASAQGLKFEAYYVPRSGGART
jgi:hypothetical protein